LTNKKITFKLVISHWTHEILHHIVVSSGQHHQLNMCWFSLTYPILITKNL